MNFDEKISFLKKLNNSEICIISDFDDTLTKGIINNKRGSNSFSVFQNNLDLLGEEHVKKCNLLFEYYYNLEQNPDILKVDKVKFMQEWWEKEFNLYREFGLNKKNFNKIIDNHLIELKEKVSDFFILTNKYNISTIIFSAGIYNLIHNFLKKINADYDNIHVVGKSLEFNKKGNFIKTKGDIIHSENKIFLELSHLPIYEELKNKKACILFGDSIGDLKMVKGSNFEVILKIGFLNILEEDKNYIKRLKAHQENYDLVLDGEEDFSKIVDLVRKILSEN